MSIRATGAARGAMTLSLLTFRKSRGGACMVARQDSKTPEEAAKEAKLHIQGALAA